MQSSKSGAATPGGGLYGTRVPSPRQRQVIELVAQGLKNSEVAAVIGTTEYVVKNHLRLIYDKLGFWNRVGEPLRCHGGRRPWGFSWVRNHLPA